MKKEIQIAKNKNFAKDDLNDVVAIVNKEFDVIYKKYQPMIMRKMLYYCNYNSEMAEDLTSETMIKIIDNYNKYGVKGGKFKSWAYRIAHNVFVDRLRKIDKKPISNSISIDSLFRTNKVKGNDKNSKIQIPDENLIAHEEIALDESYEELKVAISKLSKIEQKLIELRYYENMRWDVISKKVNKNESYCKTKMFRIKKKLKEILKT